MTAAAAPGILAGAARIAAAFDIPGFMNSGMQLSGAALKMGGQAATSFAQGFRQESEKGDKLVEGPLNKAMKKAFGNAERMAAVSGQAVADSFLGGLNAIRSGDPGASFAAATGAVSSFIGVAGQAGQAVADVASEMERFGPLAEYVGNTIGIVASSMQLFTETGGQYLGMIAEIGDVYLQLRRTLAASTLDMGQVNAQMAMTQEIMASGAVDHFDDVSQSIGRFARSLNIAGPELRDFTETYASMAELVGSISPTNIAGVLNAYMPPNGIVQATGEVYDYSEQLTRFTNIIRATGGNAQAMVDSMIRVGPAMRALGYDAGGTALFFGSLIEEGLRGQKLVYGMNQIVEKLHVSVQSGRFKDLDAAWGGLLKTVKTLQEAGNKDGAIRLLSEYTTPANASLLQEAIAKGVIRDAKEMGAQAGRDFGQSLSEMAADTSSLGDVFENVQQQFDAALSPIGLAFNSFIVSGGNKLVAWLAENQLQVAEWAANIGGFVLNGFQAILEGIGQLFIGFSEWINGLTEVVGFSVMRIMDPFRLLADTLGKATWLPGSEMFKAFGDGLNAVNDGIGKLRDMDLSKPFRTVGELIDGWGGKLDKVAASMPMAVEDLGRIMAVEQALKVPLIGSDGKPVLTATGNPDYQNAYGGFDAFQRDAEGKPLKDASGQNVPISPYAPMIPIRPEMADKIKQQLKELHIEIGFNATQTMITQVKAADDEALRSWKLWLDSRTTKQQDVQAIPVGPDGTALSDISELIDGGQVEVQIVPNATDIQAYIAREGIVAPGSTLTYGPTGPVYVSPTGTPTGPSSGANSSPPGTYGSPTGLNRYGGNSSTNQPGTEAAKSLISQIFPAIKEIGGARQDPLPYHNEGRALDVMIPDYKTAAGKALGDGIVKFINDNYKSLGVQDTIWQNTWRAGGDQGPGDWMEQNANAGDTAAHYDHVHITFVPGAKIDTSALKLPPGVTVASAAPTAPTLPTAAPPATGTSEWEAMTTSQKSDAIAKGEWMHGPNGPMKVPQARRDAAAAAVAGSPKGDGLWAAMSQAARANAVLRGEYKADGTPISDAEQAAAIQDWVNKYPGLETPPATLGVTAGTNALANIKTSAELDAFAKTAAAELLSATERQSLIGQVIANAASDSAAAAKKQQDAADQNRDTAEKFRVAAERAQETEDKKAAAAEQAAEQAASAERAARTGPGLSDKYASQQASDAAAAAGMNWVKDTYGGSGGIPGYLDANGNVISKPSTYFGKDWWDSRSKNPDSKNPDVGANGYRPGYQAGLDGVPIKSRDMVQDIKDVATGAVKGVAVAAQGVAQGAAALSKEVYGGLFGQRNSPGEVVGRAGRGIADLWKFMTSPQSNTGAQYATGGPVFGAGTATSDSIPAWLSNGEFVHNAAAVAHYGPGFMHAVNQRKLPKFNAGGQIDTTGAQRDTIGLAEAVANQFGVSDIHLYRSPDGYNEHSSGQAADFMVSDLGVAAAGGNLSTGNLLNFAALALADQFGVMYTIWQNKMWYPDGRSKPYGANPNDATQAHKDHVHARTRGGGYPEGGGPGKYGTGDRIPRGMSAVPSPGASEASSIKLPRFANGGFVTHMPSVGDEGGTTPGWSADPGGGLPTPLDPRRAKRWFEITKEALGFKDGGYATHVPSLGDEGTTPGWSADPGSGLPSPFDPERIKRWFGITKEALGFSDGGEVGDKDYSSVPFIAGLQWLTDKLGWMGDLGGVEPHPSQRPPNKSGLFGGSNSFAEGGEVGNDYSGVPFIAAIQWLTDKLGWIGDLGGVEPHPSQRPPNKSGLFGGSNSFKDGGYATHKPGLGDEGGTDWPEPRGLPTPLDPRRAARWYEVTKEALGFSDGGLVDLQKELLKSTLRGDGAPTALQKRYADLAESISMAVPRFEEGGLADIGALPKDLQKELLLSALRGGGAPTAVQKQYADMAESMSNMAGGGGSFDLPAEFDVLKQMGSADKSMGWKEKLSKGVANAFSGSYWLGKAGVDTTTEGWNKQQAYVFGLSEAMGAVGMLAGGDGSPAKLSGKDLVDFFAMPDAQKEIGTIGSDQSSVAQKGVSALAMAAFVPGLGKLAGKIGEASNLAEEVDALRSVVARPLESQVGFGASDFETSLEQTWQAVASFGATREPMRAGAEKALQGYMPLSEDMAEEVSTYFYDRMVPAAYRGGGQNPISGTASTVDAWSRWIDNNEMRPGDGISTGMGFRHGLVRREDLTARDIELLEVQAGEIAARMVWAEPSQSMAFRGMRMPMSKVDELIETYRSGQPISMPMSSFAENKDWADAFATEPGLYGATRGLDESQDLQPVVFELAPQAQLGQIGRGNLEQLTMGQFGISGARPTVARAPGRLTKFSIEQLSMFQNRYSKGGLVGFKEGGEVEEGNWWENVRNFGKGIVGGAKDAVTGLAPLVGLAGEDGPGVAEAWTGLATGLAPLVGLGGEGAAGVGESWKEFGKAAINYDMWTNGQKAEAAGRNTFDILTMFIPGAGAVAKGAKATKVGSTVAGKSTEIMNSKPVQSAIQQANMAVADAQARLGGLGANMAPALDMFSAFGSGTGGAMAAAASALVPRLGKMPLEGKFADLAGKPHNLADILARTEGYERGSLAGVDISGLDELRTGTKQQKRTRDQIADATEMMLGLVPNPRYPLRTIGLADNLKFNDDLVMARNRREEGEMLFDRAYAKDYALFDRMVTETGDRYTVDGFGEHRYGIPPDLFRTSAPGQVAGHEIGGHQFFPSGNMNWATREFAVRNMFIDLHPELGLERLENFGAIRKSDGAPFSDPVIETAFRAWLADNLPTYSFGGGAYGTPAEALIASQDIKVPLSEVLAREEAPSNAIEDLMVNGFNLSPVNMAIVADYKAGLARAATEVDAPPGSGINFLPDMPISLYDQAGSPLIPDLSFSDELLAGLGGGGKAGPGATSIFGPKAKPRIDVAQPAGPISLSGGLKTAADVRELLGMKYGSLDSTLVPTKLSQNQYAALLKMFESAPPMGAEDAARLAVKNWPFSADFNPYDEEMLEAIRKYTGAYAPFPELSYLRYEDGKQHNWYEDDPYNVGSGTLQQAELVEMLDQAILMSPRVPAGGMWITRAMGNSWRKDMKGGAEGYRQEGLGFQSASPGLGDVTPWMRETMARIFVPEDTPAIYLSTPNEGDLPGGLVGVDYNDPEFMYSGLSKDRMGFDKNSPTTLSVYPNQNEIVLPRNTGLSVVKEFEPVVESEYWARQEDMLGLPPGSLTGEGSAQGWGGSYRAIREVWMVADAPTDPVDNYFRRIAKERESKKSAFAAGDDEPPFADGGAVYGPGTGTSDSIAAWLSNGEFVHNAAAVNHYGTDFMHAVNSMKLPKFAPGGLVGDDNVYFVPAASRPMVGGGEPLPDDLANYRGQYDSGPTSQFQAPPSENPFVTIPLGPRIPFEEALKAIKSYVQWQENRYKAFIETPQQLATDLEEKSEELDDRIAEAATAQISLENLEAAKRRDLINVPPGSDQDYLISGQYEQKLGELRAALDVAVRARDQAQENYTNALGSQEKNLAEQRALDVQGPPSMDSTSKSKVKGDSNAESLGLGLVEGILQGLGFGDVFDDFITEWTIFKKGVGLLGFGINVAQNAGILPAPGKGAAAVNSGLGPGTGQGIASGAFQAALPGLGSIPGVQATAGANVPSVSPASSVTPAMTPTAPDPLTQTGGSGAPPGPMVQVTNYNNGLASQEAFDYNVGAQVARHGANAMAAAHGPS